MLSGSTVRLQKHSNGVRGVKMEREEITACFAPGT